MADIGRRTYRRPAGHRDSGGGGRGPGGLRCAGMSDAPAWRPAPDGATAALARRGDPNLALELDRVIELDRRRQELVGRRDGLRAEVNDVSRDVGAALKAGDRLKAD